MKLSPTMEQLVAYMKQHGGIWRYPGGFWAMSEWDRKTPSFGTRSVEALISRGVAIYTEWQKGRYSDFPVKAQLK